MPRTMKSLLSASLVFVLVSSVCRAESWTLNEKESKITFVGGKPDGDKHEGGFKEFDATAKVGEGNPPKIDLTMDIDTTSLWSDDAKLTNHLKNPDFFDVRKYPKITFESSGVKSGEAGKTILTGKLTMLGKTQEVSIPVERKVQGSTCTLVADFTIDRTKWGMNYGEGKINAEVPINAKLVFDAKK